MPAISYRFLDYQQSSGLIIRTIHVPASEFQYHTEIGEAPSSLELEQRKQQFIQKLRAEQAANPKQAERRIIRVLGVNHDYPATWDAKLDTMMIVDAPGLQWGKGEIVI